jgi:hypothetical protein
MRTGTVSNSYSGFKKKIFIFRNDNDNAEFTSGGCFIGIHGFLFVSVMCLHCTVKQKYFQQIHFVSFINMTVLFGVKQSYELSNYQKLQFADA